MGGGIIGSSNIGAWPRSELLQEVEARLIMVRQQRDHGPERRSSGSPASSLGSRMVSSGSATQDGINGSRSRMGPISQQDNNCQRLLLLPDGQPSSAPLMQWTEAQRPSAGAAHPPRHSPGGGIAEVFRAPDARVSGEDSRASDARVSGEDAFIFGLQNFKAKGTAGGLPNKHRDPPALPLYHEQLSAPLPRLTRRFVDETTATSEGSELQPRLSLDIGGMSSEQARRLPTWMEESRDLQKSSLKPRSSYSSISRGSPRGAATARGTPSAFRFSSAALDSTPAASGLRGRLLLATTMGTSSPRTNVLHVPTPPASTVEADAARFQLSYLLQLLSPPNAESAPVLPTPPPCDLRNPR